MYRFLEVLFLLLMCIPQIVISRESIKDKIDIILEKMPKSTTAAIMIYNPNEKEIIYNKNIFKSMIPASNIKLYTTAAALEYMGPEYEFATVIATDDISFQGDTLNGNIYIKGYGNSLFSEENLDSLVEDIYNLGIKHINGRIIADDTFFDSLYLRDDWITDEKANVNLPSVSALVLDKNRLVINMHRRGNYGDPLTYRLYPSSDFIHVEMNAKVTKRWSYPRIATTINESGIYLKVTGGLRKSNYRKSYAIFIDNPPIYIGFILHDKLNKRGITISELPKSGALNDLPHY